VLWASGRERDLLLPVERAELIQHLALEEEADGGWRTTVLDQRERKDGSAAPTASDGYATGLVVLAIEESGESVQDPMLRRGIAWLKTHQQADGTWVAASINKKRDPASDAGPFMTDAATAYAALALERVR
jgi:squalene-hopene/tetraprenyl-beta-curcumene cyclase